MQIMTATQGTQSNAVARKKRKKANGSALAPARVRVSALTPPDGVSPIFRKRPVLTCLKAAYALIVLKKSRPTLCLKFRFETVTYRVL
ncbi:hypothetical protein AA0488_2671 [Kozakia baliensis NRIC 0488]|uniref:Uncharacterized protein n=1 Tax=Kozakia baliensis TaxID=153496 RepID=A0A1D8UYQ7_9PROT|nr:hypothetical protein A0U89_15380 [Kozakia baliensis]GBR33151.1 hypothetical protein AA0488_2671 [Kozakia baliensis NRIC 0488]GEL65281.1 hypothetical protein KBA01_25670 [Kozakia baliensis]